jgi:hypothetical protein
LPITGFPVTMLFRHITPMVGMFHYCDVLRKGHLNWLADGIRDSIAWLMVNVNIIESGTITIRLKILHQCHENDTYPLDFCLYHLSRGLSSKIVLFKVLQVRYEDLWLCSRLNKPVKPATEFLDVSHPFFFILKGFGD